MGDASWQKVREIFDMALQRPLHERRNFVEEACGDDKASLSEVESLLASLDSAQSFMEVPAVGELADAFESHNILRAGDRLGHYEIVSQIGAGGMGEVYLARDKKLTR